METQTKLSSFNTEQDQARVQEVLEVVEFDFGSGIRGFIWEVVMI